MSSVKYAKAYLAINHPLSGWRKMLYKKSSPSYNEIVQVTKITKEMIKTANRYNSLAHTKWLCKYHIVFNPKYRRKAIYNQYRKDLKEIIKTLCKYKGVEIIEGHLMPDHVHILVSIPPKMSVSSFMGYLKGKSALMMFDRHANMKYKFGNQHFGSVGYYVSTVGLNESTIRKYIRDQEKADLAADRLSVKEYEDPFK
jgi:putative transposase